MSLPQRRPPARLIGRLLAEPQRFGFFQSVRLLRRWLGEPGGAADAVAPAARLRFRNALSLAFAPSEVAALRVRHREGGGAHEAGGGETGADGGGEEAAESVVGVDAVELTPACFGLLGAGGPLPPHYAEWLDGRERHHGDAAARAFLDVFQDRAATLFHAAWRRHRLPVRHEDDPRDGFLPLVLSLAGVGQPALRDRLPGIGDPTLAWFSGLLQQRPVSAEVLRQAVADHFGVPVAVEPFVGRWFALPPSSASSLGVANVALGGGAVVGARVWQRDLRLRLTVGPLAREAFDRFLPGGSAALALRDLLTMFTGTGLEYEVRLALRADEVPGTTLDGARGARLGRDAFLVTRPAAAHRSDAGYDIHAVG